LNYSKVAETNELRPGEKRKVTFDGKEIFLTNLENSYYAIDNSCSHMGGSLVDGTLEGNQIICPKHGSIYDVTNGKLLQNGKLLFLKVKAKDLHSYPVKIEGTDILIGMDAISVE